MCTKAEVQEALKENNIVRDRNLDKKLTALKLEIFEKVDSSINKRIDHLKTAPETKDKFNKIDVLCATRGEQILAMKDDIQEIKEDVKNILTHLEAGLNKKTDNEQFIFWRNFLVSGMFLAIFLGVVALLMDRVLK